MRKEEKETLDDDRVIAPMNVDGMPWYDEKPSLFARSTSKKKEPPLNKKETFRLAVNATLAALLVAGIFLGGAFLFILFCVNIWLK